jgi:hypothetical protein
MSLSVVLVRNYADSMYSVGIKGSVDLHDAAAGHPIIQDVLS